LKTKARREQARTPLAEQPRELLTAAHQTPGLSEALAAFDAVRPYLPEPVPQPPQVTFTTHTNP